MERKEYMYLETGNDTKFWTYTRGESYMHLCRKQQILNVTLSPGTSSQQKAERSGGLSRFGANILQDWQGNSEHAVR